MVITVNITHVVMHTHVRTSNMSTVLRLICACVSASDVIDCNPSVRVPRTPGTGPGAGPGGIFLGVILFFFSLSAIDLFFSSGRR